MGKMSSHRLLLVKSRLEAGRGGGVRGRILSPELSCSLLVQGMEVPFTLKFKE